MLTSYKCLAPRMDGGRTWFCQGLMTRRTRTLEYDGQTYIEIECDKCHRTSYEPKDPS